MLVLPAAYLLLHRRKLVSVNRPAYAR
jgi:hypothetical protein